MFVSSMASSTTANLVTRIKLSFRKPVSPKISSSARTAISTPWTSWCNRELTIHTNQSLIWPGIFFNKTAGLRLPVDWLVSGNLNKKMSPSDFIFGPLAFHHKNPAHLPFPAWLILKKTSWNPHHRHPVFCLQEFYKHKKLSLLCKIQAHGLFNNFFGYTHNFCLSQILPKSRLVLSPATSYSLPATSSGFLK